MPDMRLESRFMSKVIVNPDTQCWDWQACKHPRGYGAYWSNGSMVPAHRYAYEAHYGRIAEEGMDCDHFRLNPGPRKAPCSTSCVNPSHIELVSHRLNVQRGRANLNAARVASAALRKAAKHCRHGHEYTEANTGYGRKGDRVCRACSRDKTRRYRDRQVAASTKISVVHPDTHKPQDPRHHDN